MADTKFKSVKVGSLLLDARNTRIPADRRTDDQRGLIHEMVQHEDVKGLAASIMRLGLFPNERLVVTKEGTSFTVLEGNRRVAAIKLLLNPELAQTDADVRYFRKLARHTDLAALSELDAAIVPNRVDAAPIIAHLHTKAVKRSWLPLQQAQFYRELIEEGQTAEEVADELGIPVSEVRKKLRSERLYRMALTLDYPEDVREKLADRRFPFTTLERFIDYKAGQRFLGIVTNDKSDFRGVVHPDRFRAVLQRVATEVATKPGLTREINKEKEMEAWIADIQDDLPKTKVRGSFSSGEILGEESEDGDQGKPKPAPRKKAPRVSKSLVPHGFPCSTRQTKVRAVYDELRKLPVEKQRNSAGVMLRVLLDVALWAYYVDNKLDGAVCDHYDPDKHRRRRKPEWSPALRELINYAVEKKIFSGMTAGGYRTVRKLLARDVFNVATIDTLNEYTHDIVIQPTEAELRAVWERAAPMLEIILR